MTAFNPTFRRNDADRRPVREVVTGRLLGDPPPCLEQRRREAAERPSIALSKGVGRAGIYTGRNRA